MKQFKNIEFITSPEGEIFYKSPANSLVELTESEFDIIDYIYEKINNDYHEAFLAISEHYKRSHKNVRFYKYLIVRRFVKCNFSNFDTHKVDIDSYGDFNFEQVPCPMRGECDLHNICCNPKFTVKLSDREVQILKLYCEPMEMTEVANELFLSLFTVDTHIKNIRRKLNIHDKAGLMKFVESKL